MQVYVTVDNGGDWRDSTFIQCASTASGLAPIVLSWQLGSRSAPGSDFNPAIYTIAGPIKWETT